MGEVTLARAEGNAHLDACVLDDLVEKMGYRDGKQLPPAPLLSGQISRIALPTAPGGRSVVSQELH